jgi:hypothetical protein
MEKSCLIHEYFHFKSFKDSKKSLLSLIGIRFMQNLMHPIPTVVYFYPFFIARTFLHQLFWVVPVIYWLSSPARNKTSFAISIGSAYRPSRMVASNCFFTLSP